MRTLILTVEWLDGIYHASRKSHADGQTGVGPPPPFQLFQAMLAGYAVHKRGDPALDAAMQHLETLDPPVIYMPDAEALETVTWPSVPNNKDEWFDRLVKGDRMGALTKSSRHGQFRIMHPRRFYGPVIYQWNANPETERHIEGLREIVESITAVGHGIDMAFARLDLEKDPPRPSGIAYTPSPTGRVGLAVPYPGAFDELERRHTRFRERIQPEGVFRVPEPRRKEARYAVESDLPEIVAEGFRLLNMNNRPLWFEGTEAIKVAGMVRHAIDRAARLAGLSKQTVSELMGHGRAGREGARIYPCPLPNIGYPHADGRISRVMLVAPKSLDEDVWLSILSRMSGAVLVPKGQTEPIGRLEPIRGSVGDPILRRYYGVNREWTTATPVVLPGGTGRRDRRPQEGCVGPPPERPVRLRPERSVRKLLQHAGISEAQLESAALEPAGQLIGSASAFECVPPAHLKDFPRSHMTLRFRQPQAGPIMLGAGIGYGLGLFLPGESSRGDQMDGRRVVNLRETLDPALADERRRGHAAWARGDYEAAERHFLAGGDENQARGARRRMAVA